MWLFCITSNLGLSADGDQAVFDRRRAVELKHGRVAMLAVTGYLIQAVSRLPGNIDLDGTTFDSVPNGIAAIGAVPSFGWLQIILSIGVSITWHFSTNCVEKRYNHIHMVHNLWDILSKFCNKTAHALMFMTRILPLISNPSIKIIMLSI
jgi:hypothetical protein